MLLRPVALLVSTCLALIALTSTTHAGETIAIRGPLKAGDSRTIMKYAKYYGDYGLIAVAEGDAQSVSAMRAAGLDAVALGEWSDSEELSIARDAFVPSDAHVLLKHAGQNLFHHAGDHAAEESACRCGHTIATVARRPWQPAREFAGGIAPQALLSADPRVSALVAQVNQTNMQNTVTQLSSYFTRRADSAQAQTAKNWIVSQLQTIPGVTVTTQTFSSSYAPNIIATIPGTSHPERIVVLGAHYDSINGGGSSLAAPGADDNATGSAGILEAARILAQQDFEYTIRLMFYCAEELGLVGSDYDAQQLAASGADVVAMLNMDMIGHLQAGDTYDLDFTTNNSSATLTQFCRDVTAAYVPGLGTKTGVLTAGTSDHQSYSSAGFPAAFFFEDLDQYSMVIHTANDTLGSSANSFVLAKDIVKAFIASAALIAKPVDLAIAHTPLVDTANGSGPYPVAANVTSLIGSTPSSVELFYRVNGGAWQSRAMLPGNAVNQFVSSIPGVFPNGDVDYYLLAIDSNGFTQYSPDEAELGSVYHDFSVGNSSTLFFDDFDGASSGWTSVQVTSQNDWQIGSPNGESTDPSTAFSGSQVRGNDLGAGNFNGEYAANVENYLESPAINCAGQSNVRLSYRRWLGVEDGFYDQAKVEVNNITVWQNPVTPGGGSNNLVDTAWTHVEHDISAQAANNPTTRIRFRMKSDGGLQFGGWTIDDLRVFAQGQATKNALSISESYFSQSLGGSAQFAIAAGAAQTGRTYVIGMSLSGTSPGTTFGSVTIPLVFDAATNVGFTLLNTPFFANFAGVLGANGTASATLNLPPLGVPTLAGQNLSFAAFTISPVTYASNAVTLTIVP